MDKVKLPPDHPLNTERPGMSRESRRAIGILLVVMIAIYLTIGIYLYMRL